MLLGGVLLLEMVKALSLYDCHYSVQNEGLDASECGWGYVLDNENYSEDLKPVHYCILIGSLVSFVFIKGLASVMKSNTPLEYLINAQTLYNSKWNKIVSIFCGVVVGFFLVFGFISSDGGTARNDPILYWTTAIIAFKEFIGGLKKPLCPIPNPKISDLSWKDIVKSSVMSIIVRKNLKVEEGTSTAV